ncbi:MAG: hypothetical protein ACRC8M_10725 [Cetobacterium sp.]|uniref:hypothetical protein n=1 Tax=Cetobacterium sp. TaxID=2071632 RepID=UPI003F405C6F
MLKKLAYLSPLALLIFQGCTSLMDGHLVAVDSHATKTVQAGTYYLSSKGTEAGLQKQTFENSLQNMLASKGYTRTFVNKGAQYNIVYDYTVTGPFTTEEKFSVPETYGGYHSGLFEETWYTNIHYVNYFVKALSLSAYANNVSLWRVKGHVQAETPDLNQDYQYLISGISNYIDQSSGKVVYVNVVKNSKTGDYTATKW